VFPKDMTREFRMMRMAAPCRADHNALDGSAPAPGASPGCESIVQLCSNCLDR
jgi:hypothetical protein